MWTSVDQPLVPPRQEVSPVTDTRSTIFSKTLAALCLAPSLLGSHVEKWKRTESFRGDPILCRKPFQSQVWVYFNYTWTQEPAPQAELKSPDGLSLWPVKICLSLWLSQEPDITLIIKQQRRGTAGCYHGNLHWFCLQSLVTRAFYCGSLGQKASFTLFPVKSYYFRCYPTLPSMQLF